MTDKQHILEAFQTFRDAAIQEVTGEPDEQMEELFKVIFFEGAMTPIAILERAREQGRTDWQAISKEIHEELRAWSWRHEESGSVQ